MALRAACSALLLALCACAPAAQNLRGALASCSADPSSAHHLEVYVPDARVADILGLRNGPSGVHEGFVIAVGRQTLRVEDNADITGQIPLQRGETISLLGQLECDDDVIHWTHHDPRGRHMGGYIEANGTRYQ